MESEVESDLANENNSEKQKKIDAYVSKVRKNFMAGYLEWFWFGSPSGTGQLSHSRTIQQYISPEMEELIAMHPVGKFLPPSSTVFDTVSSSEMDMITNSLLSRSDIIVRKRDPEYLRYIIVKCSAHFECPKCTRDWISHNALLKFDLYKREVVWKYRRKCTRCHIWADSYLTREKFEVIAKRTIHYYKKWKIAKGIIPSFENKGIDKDSAITSHSEDLCERCHELGEPCWLYLLPIVKSLPYIPHDLVRVSLTGPLSKFFASIRMYRDDSGNDYLHILPSKKSSSITKWREKCEDTVGSFLRGYSGQTIPVQPDLLPKLQGVIDIVKSKLQGVIDIVKSKLQGVIDIVKSKPSVYFEKQTMLQIVAATKQQVGELLEKIKHINNMNTEENLNNKKSKPCIIPW